MKLALVEIFEFDSAESAREAFITCIQFRLDVVLVPGQDNSQSITLVLSRGHDLGDNRFRSGVVSIGDLATLTR